MLSSDNDDVARLGGAAYSVCIACESSSDPASLQHCEACHKTLHKYCVEENELESAVDSSSGYDDWSWSADPRLCAVCWYRSHPRRPISLASTAPQSRIESLQPVASLECDTPSTISMPSVAPIPKFGLVNATDSGRENGDAMESIRTLHQREQAQVQQAISHTSQDLKRLAAEVLALVAHTTGRRSSSASTDVTEYTDNNACNVPGQSQSMFASFGLKDDCFQGHS